MAADDLEWLGTWYQQQCNGRWEHQKGMLLEPLTESGDAAWKLSIDLRGTTAAGSAHRRMQVRGFDGQWLHCRLWAHRFDGAGSQVEEVIGVFRRWIEIPSPGTEAPLLEAASAG